MSAHTFGGGAAPAFSGPGSRRRHVRISRIFAITAPAANNGFVSLFPPGAAGRGNFNIQTCMYARHRQAFELYENARSTIGV
jgi:hypothetical protein